jgi:cystathionine gamma-synthase
MSRHSSTRTKPATIAARHGIASDAAYGAVVPPLYLSTNFTFEGFDRRRKYDYTRSGNPTRDLLATTLAELEGGAGAVVTASGLAAITLVLHLPGKGARVLAPHDGYGGTWRLLRALADKGWLEVELADLTDPAARDAALARSPSLVWIETPSNPLLRITDLAETCAAAKRTGALVAVDNTFLSPLLQQPLRFGADLVVHSTTKYLNGHSDVVGGAVIAATTELHEKLTWWANCLGLTGAPFDSFLTLRGVRSLAARMRVHEENAALVARFLAGHPAVARVFWPGLESHAGHDLARRQQAGFGAMISFELAGEDATARRDVARFLDRLELFSLAESLGGVESLIAHPATMTHAAMSPEARAAAGISDRLLRISVGIEDADDLVADLARALKSERRTRVTAPCRPCPIASRA